MTKNKVTVIELSRRPFNYDTTFVVFEDSSKVKEFLDHLSNCPQTFWIIEEIRELSDIPKFGFFRQVFYNVSFDYLRSITGQG